jgi:hypothetical protein
VGEVVLDEQQAEAAFVLLPWEDPHKTAIAME